VRRLLKRTANRFGYDIVRQVEPAPFAGVPAARPATDSTPFAGVPAAPPATDSTPAHVDVVPHDIDAATRETYNAVRAYTMTSVERVAALCEAVRYVGRNHIPGDLVECGVWRGGSMLAAARTLLADKDSTRTLWLYDTFAGMSEPTEADKRASDKALASELLVSHDRDSDLWAVSGLAEVKRVMSLCSYPADKIRYVEGRVEDTIPEIAPDLIAVLRLDTDWYESTRHELAHLVPRVTPGGVLIIDDYGFWQGARRAVDEFLEASKLCLLLNRIDETGRIAVIPP
jgi:O-methyltransferase